VRSTYSVLNKGHLLKGLSKSFYLYLLKEIVAIYLLSLGLLTFLLVMSRLGKIADLVINRGVSLKDIILLIVYSSPPYLTFTLPMAFLLSTILVLGRLSTENEILALKASGVDLRKLFVPIVVIAFAVTFFGLLNTHILLPKSGQLFRDRLIEIIKKGITIEDKEGIFNDTIPGVVIYIDHVDTQNKQLTGVLVSDDRDKDVKQTISAEKGIINMDSSTLDLYFALENGTLQRWEKARDVYRSMSFKKYSFAMNLTNVLPYHRELRKKSYEMDRDELKTFMTITDEGGRYELMVELYRKVALPFSCIAFVFLTVPLGVKRKVGGKFSGVVYSLILFVFYYVLLAVTENLGKSFRLPFVLTAFLPNIIIAAIGLYLGRNINGEEGSKASHYLKYLWGRYLEKA
jgi:lipopolysaccharide export system permease protein